MKNINASYVLDNDNKCVLQKAFIRKDKLIFEERNGFDVALSDGFFLVKIPKTMELSFADKFAQNFYKPKKNSGSDSDRFRGYSEIGPDILGDPLLGFHQRKYQIEQFLLERRFWKKYYPIELVSLGNALCELSSIIISNVMEKINIPRKYWAKGTGNCADGNGAYHFTFNHFRPQMATLGLQQHQDDGFITILRSVNPGLEIYKDNQWYALDAEPDYFKINFGLTMQILTEFSEQPVSAVMHRVIQQEQTEKSVDRWSWGHFSSAKFDTEKDNGIYSYQPAHGLIYKSGAREHINQNDSDIYK